MPTERNRRTSSSEIPFRYSSVRYTVNRIASGIIRRTRPIQWSEHTLKETRLEAREEISREHSGQSGVPANSRQSLEIRGDFEIGIGRRARRAYGFDEVALVPGGVTINPSEVDISFRLGDLVLPVPIWASAMDGVVDVDFAIAMGRLGGLAVLNLDGVHTRYEDSRPVVERIARAGREEVNQVLRDAYQEPVKPDLITGCVARIKAAGVPCAVSTVPAHAEQRARLAEDAGADVLVVQGTVLTARHVSQTYHQLSF